MIAVLQRVSEASVTVPNENSARTVGQIGPGLLILLCAEQGDTEAQADALLAKVLKLRIFSDAAGKMNLSVQNIDGQNCPGGLLIVSQFTLAAETSGGNRPSFTRAAGAEQGLRLYTHFVSQARKAHEPLGGVVQTGEFGADMKVALLNDGPVTIYLKV
jgi:D-aminoacyl-tRNA deacylase